jgi:hypothetical protein
MGMLLVIGCPSRAGSAFVRQLRRRAVAYVFMGSSAEDLNKTLGVASLIYVKAHAGKVLAYSYLGCRSWQLLRST